MVERISLTAVFCDSGLTLSCKWTFQSVEYSHGNKLEKLINQRRGSDGDFGGIRMAKSNKLLKTNALVSTILIVGFILTAILSYRANYQASLNKIEDVSALTAQGIYYQLSAMFARPLNISLTMAHDSLLVEHLSKEQQYPEDEEYVETIKGYLDAYRVKYGFDSVFLVSTVSGRYYNFNGLDRVLEKGPEENVWYFDLLESGLEYSMNVDNDEVKDADNEITVFVNCKIFDTDGSVIGVVGVGIRMDYLKELLKGYEDQYGIKASLIDEEGTIQISTSYTGFEKVDWFNVYGQERIRKQILGWKEDGENLETWTDSSSDETGKSYVVSRYIPELSWSLIVEQNTGQVVAKMRAQLYETCFILIAVILIVLLVITTVIRNFNRQITELVEERQAMFKKATEQLYDSIYEMNLTQNSYVGKQTEEYFASLGAGGLPFDQGLRVIAEKQIKEEYREGYVSMFAPENAIREFEAGNDHLRYDFMIAQDGTNYHWMRVDAYLFYSEEDRSIHMFTYRKNIDGEKKKELEALTDEMTGFLTKSATERLIIQLLSDHPDRQYAFFIIDIDNFKQANDQFGHAFGDDCIRGFAEIIRKHVQKDAVIGRVGGDEFVVFLTVPDSEWTEEKAQELSEALDTVHTKASASWHMSASIGVALSPQDGEQFELLYRHADQALYQRKQQGKNGFTRYGVDRK